MLKKQQQRLINPPVITILPGTIKEFDAMKDLEKAPLQEEEEPLFLEFEKEEEYNNSNKNVINNQSVSSPSILLSPKRRNRSPKYLVVCILITVIVALVTVLVPVSHGRLTTIKTAFKIPASASTINSNDDADNDTTKSTKEALAVEESSEIVAQANNDEANEKTSPSRMHVDYHTNRFDYTSSWCPKANCKGTSICYPCQRRWLIIVATGRSASTTLTEMVARLPGVRMTGENNNLISRFENVLKTSPPEMLSGKSAAWFHDNSIPEESFSCASQTVFTTFNPPKLNNDTTGTNNDGEMLEESDEKTILGFKTIRFFHDEIQKANGKNLSPKQIQEIVNAKIISLNHLFPCARFVINYRSDMMQQVASWKAQFHANNATSTMQTIQLDNDMLRTFQTTLGSERSILLDSTDWTQNITVFNEMLDWLGFSKACHFSAALEYNTQNGYKATKTEVDLSPDCMYLY
jgi:hypothetical protein